MLPEPFVFQILFKYAPGPYSKSTLLHEHVCYMLLEQYAFQVWSWSIFNLEYSSRLLMVRDHKVLMVQNLGPYGPWPYYRAKIAQKLFISGEIGVQIKRCTWNGKNRIFSVTISRLEVQEIFSISLLLSGIPVTHCSYLYLHGLQIFTVTKELIHRFQVIVLCRSKKNNSIFIMLVSLLGISWQPLQSSWF